MNAPHPPAPDPDLLASIRADQEREDRGWRRLRSWPTPWRFGALVGLLGTLELLVFFGNPRPDIGVYPWAQLVVAIVALAAASAAGARLLLHPPHLRAPSGAVLGATAVGLLLLPIAFSLLPPPHDHLALHPESFEGSGADFVRRAMACLVFGVLIALPLTAFAVAVDRRPLLGTVRIALVAGAGGVAGTLGLLLHCPVVGVSHRVAGHSVVGVVVALLLAGVLLLMRRMRKSSLPASNSPRAAASARR